ncbi:MAG: GNAT family N-acetyltransferase [Gammaproteobacteria bacterium]|nr:GNAT family N-acetyltransferase [Gammaproteobacteria bacterium]
MSPEPAIRRATAADIDVIHALLEQLASSMGQQHRFRGRAADFLRFGFSDQPHFEALLAEQDGAIIGLCLYFYNFSSWRGELGVYIQDLVVDQRVRTRGTGRALVRETVRQAQRRGATHLRLSVEKDNEGAIRFYEKIGLKQSASECIFAAVDDDFQKLAETS